MEDWLDGRLQAALGDGCTHMSFDQHTLVLPDGTSFHERHIEVEGDVVVSDRGVLEFGIQTPARVFLGEGVRLVGHIRSKGDVHADLFSHVDGDVTSQGSVYLGERAHITGKLSVARDLDVGDDVKIEEGFEARGWINIRNPVPVVVYIFLYLMQMMNAGRSDEVERILGELSVTEDVFHITDSFMFVPSSAQVGLTATTTGGPLRVGEQCRVLGNFVVEDFANIGARTMFHGSLRAKGDVRVGPDVEVHGDLDSKGHVVLGPRSRVHGSLSADSLELHGEASVDGTILAPGGVRFIGRADRVAKNTVDSFNEGKNPDLVRMLE